MPKSAPEILIDTPAAALYYHPDEHIVHHEFKRFVHGRELREVLERGHALLVEHSACKWLSDDRGNGPLKPADEEWCKSQWFPQVKSAGWKHWAVVMPERVVGQMNMRRWIEMYAQLGINAHPFHDPVEALGWLKAQNR